MFTANLENYQIQHEELIRQARNYRLVRMVKAQSDLISQIQNALGRLLIVSGEGLLTFAEANR